MTREVVPRFLQDGILSSMRKTALGLILTALLTGGSYTGYKIVKDTKADAFENSVHRVMHIVDGDTIDIENQVRIRLLGIDAPEKTTCYYQDAKAALTELLKDADIRIEKDISGADRYDRLLRYVYLPASDPAAADIFVNHWLVEQGYATTLGIAPDNRYRDLLASAMRDAREHRRGLWSDDCPYFSEYQTADDLREDDSKPADATCTIKGNISEKAYGKLYFTEGCPNYNRIKIDPRKGEQYFCTEQEAQAAGFTRSQSCTNTF